MLPKEGILFMPGGGEWLIVGDQYKDRVNELMEKTDGLIKTEEVLEYLKEHNIPFLYISNEGRNLVTKTGE